jgi:hypothetical protein
MAFIGIAMFAKDNAYAIITIQGSNSNTANSTTTTSTTSGSTISTMNDLLFIFTAVPFGVNFFLMATLYS